MSGERQRRRPGRQAGGSGGPLGWPTPYPLPKDAAELVMSNVGRCRNLGLWLDRLVAWRDRDDKGRPCNLGPIPSAKRREAPALTKQAEGSLRLDTIDQLMKGYHRRWARMLASYREKGFVVQDFSATPDWRVVVGLGGTSILETSITLHRLYGFPIIPGSALKGLTRAYAETVLRKPPDDPELIAICGTPPRETPMQAGQVVFFDAIPTTPPRLKLDVMNPHYGEYYRGGKTPPADYLSPVPVYFLTVGEGSQLLFAVAARKGEVSLAQTAATWLREALQTMGVGAKTTAGYGYFRL